MIALSLLNLVGNLAISIMLVLLALLSQRLGRVTRARPYFYGLYAAAMMFTIAGLLRFLFLNGRVFNGMTGYDPPVVLLVNGLSAVAITLAIAVMWFYWSWLLAERD